MGERFLGFKKSRLTVRVLFVKNVFGILGLIVVVFVRYILMLSVTRMRVHLVRVRLLLVMMALH